MFGNKQPFGANTSFGQAGTFGSTSTPFGQGTSAFAASKPLGSTFTAQPFGTMQTGSSIFGSSTGTSNIFGSGTNAFNQASGSTGTTGFGGFGSTAPATGSLFGSSNQPAASSTGLFSNTSGSAFGAAKPSFGGFSSSATTGGSIFSQNAQQQPQQTGLITAFNPSGSSAANLFGGTAFGAGATGPNGTTVKFSPVNGSDTMMKNGTSTNISTRHMCITVMKEYESKSLEELRVEDYLANRKGPNQVASVTGFGASNQPSLFGNTAAASTSGLFGQNQNKAIFGTNTGGFGSTTGTSLFGQGAQNVSPFSKPVAFNTATPASSNFTFGGGTTGFGNTNQAKTLFGQAPLQTSGTSLFGATTATQPTQGFGTTGSFGAATSFGAQTQTANPFGNKPVAFGTATTSAPSFSFGSNTATNSNTFMFNQKPAAGTGFSQGFGSTSTGFGGFGNPTSTSTGGLFGQNKTQGFGTGFGGGLGTAGTSMFGSAANKPGGLNLSSAFGTGSNSAFGATSLQPISGAFSFGSSGVNPGSDVSASLLGQQQALVPNALQSLAVSPYGDSPLFRNMLKDPAKSEKALQPTSPEAQKYFTEALHKVSSVPRLKLKPRPLLALNSNKSSLFDGFDEEDSSLINDSFLPRRSVKRLVLPTSLFNSTRLSVSLNNTALSSDDSLLAQRTPREHDSSESLTTPLTKRHSAGASRLGLDISIDILPDSMNSGERERRQVSLDDTISALNIHQKKDRSKPPGEGDNPPESKTTDEDERDEPALHPAGIVLKRPGYYTIPSLEELANMVDEDGACFVENFTIGRENYGNVYFPGITNVAKLNFDEIVHFRMKEVTVYPNDDMKPPVGQGLNKRAQITLDCVWPNDKTSHTPIKNPERLKLMNYQEKLEKITARLAAKFIEYRPETGSWVFQVNHFSKYGLEDSDEDDDGMVCGDQGMPATAPPRGVLAQPQQFRHINSGEAQKTPNGTLGTIMESVPPLSSLSHMATASVPLRLRDHEEDDEMEGIAQQAFPAEVSQTSIDEERDSLVASVLPSSHRLAEVVGASSRRVQSMKASFFWEDAEGDENEGLHAAVDSHQVPRHFINGAVPDKATGRSSERASTVSPTLLEPSQRLRLQSFSGQDVVHRPKVVALSSSMSALPKKSGARSSTDRLSKFALLAGGGAEPAKTSRIVAVAEPQRQVPIDKSLLRNKQHLFADAACFMGRSFRVGWGPNFSLAHVGSPLGEPSRPNVSRIFQPFAIFAREANYAERKSPFSVTIETISFLPSVANWDAVTVANMEKCLEAQLSLTKLGSEGGCPFAVPCPGLDLMHCHADLARTMVQNTSLSHPDAAFLKQCRTVWELVVALWGRLPDDGCNRPTDEVGDYSYHIARREAFSAWLMNTVKPIVAKEIEAHKNDVTGHLETVFSYLTGLQIDEASHAARENKDFRLSMLISQAAGILEARDLIRKQLDHWEESKADRFIAKEPMKIYALLAGTLVWPSSESVVNTCENLDWKRALALHLWYHCPSMGTISDALKEYEVAFKGSSPHGCYAQPPNPAYLETKRPYFDHSKSMECQAPSETSSYDTCYHILKLHSDQSHRLDCLLTPTTYTHDPLDHRLSWLLAQALKAFGFHHFSEWQDTTLHVNFASQLCAVGLWQWAVFVLLHISDAVRRKAALVDLLNKHVSTGSNTESETVLREKLCIPQEWIFEAKAVRARSQNDVFREAYYLLKSKHWNRSHKLIIRHIAPDAIINENYDYLKVLLEELAPPERNSVIIDWNVGGQVYLDYIHLSQIVDKIIKGELSAYKLEGLQPEVTSLCNRVGNLQCFTAKDRLCVSEMAKKTANLLRAVLSLGSGMTTIPSRLLAPHINKLPLPEDYSIQELRALTHSYFLEMT